MQIWEGVHTQWRAKLLLSISPSNYMRSALCVAILRQNGLGWEQTGWRLAGVLQLCLTDQWTLVVWLWEKSKCCKAYVVLAVRRPKSAVNESPHLVTCSSIWMHSVASRSNAARAFQWIQTMLKTYNLRDDRYMWRRMCGWWTRTWPPR